MESSKTSPEKHSEGALGVLPDEDVGEVSADVAYGEAKLVRSLSQRHLVMMAIGGVIGPGYFIGMGTGLSTAGPAGLLLCFALIGILLWTVMQCLGELGSFISVSGSFVHYTARFVDPAVGFALGWNYWLLWAGIIMAEYNNLGLVLTYWDTPIPRWGWVLIFWVFFMLFAMLGVKSFGEAEFWLASIKIAALAVFFLCAILITSGVIGGQTIGFSFYKDPGPLANGARGVFEVFVFAALQYSGSEMIGLTAGESRNPAEDVPKAVKGVLWRIIVIFLGGVFFLTLTVPYDDPDLLSATSKTAQSPFVIAFARVGATAGADAVNAVIVITILSAVNSSLYVGSRTLVALANQKQAPAIFAKTTEKGVPIYALVTMNLTGFLSLLNLSSGAGKFYSWVVSMTGVATFITWACICLSQIRLRQALIQQGVSTDVLPFKIRSQVIAWVGLVINVFFIFFQGWTAFTPWDLEMFFKNYIIIIMFIILVVCWKFQHKTRFVCAEDADLISHRRSVLQGLHVIPTCEFSSVRTLPKGDYRSQRVRPRESPGQCLPTVQIGGDRDVMSVVPAPPHLQLPDLDRDAGRSSHPVVSRL